MAEKILKKDKLDDFVKELKSKYRLFAPLENETDLQWSELEQGKDLTFDFFNSSLSPKKFFFPQTECLMHFKNDPKAENGMIMEPEEGLAHPRLLVNIRPCDAKALVVLDKVFERDDQSFDIYWKDKREQTVLIGLACKDPCPTCFCTSVDCGPHHEEGLDILQVDLGDRLLLRGLTEKGDQLLQDLDQAGAKDVRAAQEQKEQAEGLITSGVDMDRINSRQTLEVYDQAMWDRIYESCINCGTCTFFCPTCHCFDIQDETQGDYGRRVRNWDTCMSWLFTHHTSGHNPRGTKKDRVRQRFMHKFKYMPIKLEGSIGCVGCGRCTQKCPVNIDVRSVVNSMNEEHVE